MAQYRKKPVIIEAVQWFPGATVEGVAQQDPELIFSRSGHYFYLSAMGSDGFIANAWLAVDDEKALDGPVLPFVFWSVKTGERRTAAADDPLTKKYLEYMKHETLPTAYGLIETLEGRMSVAPGDWIITGVKGEKYPCKPDIFEATYERVHAPDPSCPMPGNVCPEPERPAA